MFEPKVLAIDYLWLLKRLIKELIIINVTLSFNILNFGTGYNIGDIITISGGNNDATFVLNLFSSLVLKISPSPSATNDTVSVNCLTNPTTPNWDFNIGTVGQYIFKSVGNNSSSVDFQLDISEQNNIIINIVRIKC